MLNQYKWRHFYFNKYIVSCLPKKKYFISYDYHHKALWFRVFKAGSRSIDCHLKNESVQGAYIYSSEVGYIPFMFRHYFKFAFVRNPETRFISAWKDKVLNQNYFRFSEEKHERMKELDNFIEWVKTLDIQRCDEHLREQCSLIDLNHIDFLGRLEFFERDFNYLADKIGLRRDNPIHLNKTNKNTDLHLSYRQKREIQNIYKRDFEILYPQYNTSLVHEELTPPPNDLSPVVLVN